MDRRRALTQRPSSQAEEIQWWSQAAIKLTACRDVYNNPATLDAMQRVNRAISAWPDVSGENGEPPAAIETIKATYKKLSSGLSEVRDAAELEAKAIEEALESLSVIIAIKKSPETQTNQDKRSKRNRGSSPLSNPSTPAPTPPPQTFKNDPKSRSRPYARQFPLQENRKVAFRPPSTGGAEADENTWILAVVTRCLNQEKHRYEVQDPEPQEDGQPGQRYQATVKSMIPLPDPDAPLSSPSHPNSYPVFSTGDTVMALYPDTSCFYRAEVTEVVSPPREGRVNSAKHAYRLRFEDDDDQIHTVAAQWVVAWPSS